MWISYVRVTTTCRDGTSILLRTQDSQPVLHKVGVSVFQWPSGDPRSPSVGLSDCTVDTPGWPGSPLISPRETVRSDRPCPGLRVCPALVMGAGGSSDVRQSIGPLVVCSPNQWSPSRSWTGWSTPVTRCARQVQLPAPKMPPANGLEHNP